MLDFLTRFASAATEAEAGGDLLGSLGIDPQMLILQAIAFILLVLIVAKFIYPPIVDMLDRHDKAINDAMKAAKEAQEKADESEAKTAELLKKAKTEANDIVKAAKKESADIVAEAEEDASKKADAIIENARADITREVEAARKSLRSEVVDLVAIATEKVVDAKIDDRDDALIQKTLEEYK